RGRRRPRSGPSSSRPDQRRGALEGLDVVGLDQRVRQELRRQALDGRPGCPVVDRLDRQLDPAADADLAHALDAEVAQAALHGPPLRIENPRLRPDVDRVADLHERQLHAPTTSSSRYLAKLAPVIRSNASTYRARVPATTSGGSSGPGAALSHGWRSSQSRTNCLSKLVWGPPASYVAASQNRDESGVSASSTRVSSPSMRPISNFVSARM